MQSKITPTTLKLILEEHDSYWLDDGRKNDNLRWYRAYSHNFWQNKEQASNVCVETPTAFSFVESYQASLFGRDPAVIVSPGVHGKGNSTYAQNISNEWLKNHVARPLKRASEDALIFDYSGIKLVPNDSEDAFQKVTLVPLKPWEMIIDETASTWDEQRFCGHIYFIPLQDALKKFGHRKEDYEPVEFCDYLKESKGSTRNSKYRTISHPINDTSNLWSYIQCVELYVEDKLYFWSPNFKDGGEFLSTETNPFLTYDQKYIAPIVGFYYSQDPQSPLRGYSMIKRYYDIFEEENRLRSFFATSSRRVARIYIAKAGALDEELKQAVKDGIDGTFCESEYEGDIREAVQLLPQGDLPAELINYYKVLDQDLNKGSVMAPFTRGQATNATATEVTALAQYTASEVGMLARERDYVIESIVAKYLPILSLYLEATEPQVIYIRGENFAVKPQDLMADFRIHARDQASTPMAIGMKQQILMGNIQMFTQLFGEDYVKEEMARYMEVPSKFMKPTKPTKEEASQTLPTSPVDLATGLEAGNLPSPQRITKLLPE